MGTGVAVATGVFVDVAVASGVSALSYYGANEKIVENSSVKIRNFLNILISS